MNETLEIYGKLDPFFILIPILAFIICYHLYLKYGKAKHVEGNGYPEFKIPGTFLPIEFSIIINKGYLNDDQLRMAATASIIRLAILDYIKIEEVKEEILFVKGIDFNIIRTEKNESNDINESEKVLLNRIFSQSKSVTLSTAWLIRTYLLEFSESIVKKLSEQGIVDIRGNKYRRIMGLIAILFFILPLLTKTLVSALAILITSGILFIFSSFLSKLTPKGLALKDQIKTFKSIELKSDGSFEDKKIYIESLLPYAISLGIPKSWLEGVRKTHGEEFFNIYTPSFIINSLPVSDFDTTTKQISEFCHEIGISLVPLNFS